MQSAFDIEIDQLAGDAHALFEDWVRVLLLPLKCLGAIGGGSATHYGSVEFAAPTSSVSQSLEVGQLTIGIPRVGQWGEQIPAAALRVVPSTLPAGQTAFRLVCDARQLSGTPGGTYWGNVTCLEAGQAQGNAVPVAVWLVIP